MSKIILIGLVLITSGFSPLLLVLAFLFGFIIDFMRQAQRLEDALGRALVVRAALAVLVGRLICSRLNVGEKFGDSRSNPSHQEISASGANDARIGGARGAVGVSGSARTLLHRIAMSIFPHRCGNFHVLFQALPGKRF